MSRRIYIETHGCQMNARDSERMRSLAGAGYTATADPEQADLLLLNTCTVREKPREKVFSAVGRWVRIKRRRPGVVIAVSGCVAQQEGERLRERVPEIDLVLGTHQIHRLGDYLGEIERGGPPVVAVDRLDEEPARFVYPVGADLEGRVTAFVTIMEGCDKVCSFCIVPYVRGREVSRPADEIVREVETLVDRGAREVTLLGQNVNAYGKRPLGGPAGEGFAGLLARLARIPGLLRIRYTSPHPKDFDEPLRRAHAVLPPLARHIHLPVQSGSDRVLERMRRLYTRAEYLELIRRLRGEVADLALTTDVIVGFPGETEGDFRATVDLLEEVRFDQIFAFKYSPRPHTAALRAEGAIPPEVRQERLQRLVALQRSLTLAERSRLVGRTVEILVEGRAPARGGEVRPGPELTSGGGVPRIKATMLAGRTSQNHMVHFPGDPGEAGRLRAVRVDRVTANALYGTPAGA